MHLKISHILSASLIILSVSANIRAQEADKFYRESLTYISQGAYQQALHSVGKAIAMDSTKDAYFLLRAQIQYELGNYDGTIKDCYTTLRLSPDKPEVYILRGQVCMVTKSYGPAILFYGKAMKYATGDDLRFEAYVNRGKAFLAIQRLEEALADFNLAFAIDNSALDALIPLADCYLRMEKFDLAVETLNKALTQDAKSAPAHKLLGKVYFENGDYSNAISATENYITLKPEEISSHNFLAELYLHEHDFENAQKSLNNSLILDPLEPKAYKIRGLIFIEEGDTEKGCNTLFRAMQLGYFEKYGYDLLDIYRQKCEE